MDVLLPATLAEACDLLEPFRDGGAAPVPIAGGTDLLVHWPVHLEARERTYLDLSPLDELKTIEWTDDELVLGGLVTYWQVLQDAACRAAFPLLIEAGRQVGAVQIQARGTWAGNIVNASPAADGVPVLMAYDATVELVSAEGRESVPLSDFYLGYKEMRRRPDQLIAAVRLPRREYDYQRFEKVGSRRAQAITKVGLAVTHSAGGWRVVANSMAPTVCRCPALEALLETGSMPSSPDDLLPAIEQDVAPIDDIRSTAAYRKRVMARVLFHLLEDLHPAAG